MNKEKFVDELKVKEKGLHCEVDYAYKQWRDNVEPYLHLIPKWKNDDKMNMDEIRKVLGVSKALWDSFKTMPTMKEYYMAKGSFMQAVMEKEFVEAKRKNQGNAKFHDMGFKLYHPAYGSKSDVNVKVPDAVNFNIQSASMSDEEIKKKAGVTGDEDID